ncbi:MAG: N-formylglutamate deformylase [uncultured bacterium]|nr:MAG: N-formylglutamate deformylase [uncultured bacterium]HBR71906.1 hypothetical protein [Candidatus Moranbacteria bacterium]
MNPESLNFPFAGTKERYEKWENESVAVANIIELSKREKGFNLPDSLQEIKDGKITPEKAVDIDNRALENSECPNVIFGRPHAGEFVPMELWEMVTEDEGKTTFPIIDRGTEFIFRNEKIPSVGTKISRFAIDPNRPPLPGMKMGKTKALGEVLWKKGISGNPMYKEGKIPTDEKITDLSERFYLPYYNGMMATVGSLIDRTKDKEERILVLDGHSFMISQNDIFKPFCEHYGIKDLKDLPLFIIGDRDGESCDEDIREIFAQTLQKNFEELSQEEQTFLFRNSGEKRLIGVNEYMKGVRNVQFFGDYGKKTGRVNSLQLELNEGMYVDEANGDYFNAEYNQRGLELVKKLIEKTVFDINPFLKNN